MVVHDQRDDKFLVVDVLYKVVLADFTESTRAREFIRERIRDYNSPIVQRHKR